MVYQGQIKNGVAVLDGGVTLPEGTVVRVEPVMQRSEPTLADRLRDVQGAAEGLPPDLAANHDHYLHGRPRK
jgi:hypothetical protein